MIDERRAIELVRNELNRASARYDAMRSQHEGYAVVLEEVDEAWDAIKANNAVHARDEMIQVAAMAIRFLVDCCELDASETLSVGDDVRLTESGKAKVRARMWPRADEAAIEAAVGRVVEMKSGPQVVVWFDNNVRWYDEGARSSLVSFDLRNKWTLHVDDIIKGVR